MSASHLEVGGLRLQATPPHPASRGSGIGCLSLLFSYLQDKNILGYTELLLGSGTTSKASEPDWKL